MNTAEFKGLDDIYIHYKSDGAVAQWLRCCTTIRKVAGSMPVGVSGFFVDMKSF